MIKVAFLFTVTLLCSSSLVASSLEPARLKSTDNLPNPSQAQGVPSSPSLSVHPSKSSPTMLGGYKMLDNPSGNNFERALRQAIQSNRQYNKVNLIMTEIQTLPDCTNYRLSFRTNNGINQTTISIQPKSPKIYMYSSTKADEKTIQSFIQTNYPQVKGYNIAEISQSPFSFQVSLQKNFINGSTYQIKYSKFSIHFLQGEPQQCGRLMQIDVSGCTMGQLISFYNDLIQKFPQLKEYKLKNIKNISQQELLFIFQSSPIYFFDQRNFKVKTHSNKTQPTIKELSYLP